MHPEEPRVVGQIERRVLRFVRDHALIPSGATVLVAVSGGPDSLALLHIIARRRDALDIEVIAAYIDHQMRPSAEIAAERDFVAAEAGRCGVRFVSARSGGGRHRVRGVSPEDAARRGRYAALAALAAEAGAGIVATGHTRSDQAETVVLRMLRGSGLRGLAAMAPAAAWPVTVERPPMLVRPLLGLSRAETEAYCAALGLEPRWDPENANPRYLRNRLRSEVLPLLASLNPQIERVLSDIAGEVAEWRAAIEGEGAGTGPRVEVDGDGRRQLVLEVEELRRLAAPVRRVRLRSALEAVAGGSYRPGRAHLRALDRLALGPRGRSIALPAGARAWRTGGALVMTSSAPPAPPALESDVPVNVPGVTELPGWSIVANRVAAADRTALSVWEQDFDPVAVEGMRVGPRRPGDRIALAGMRGRRRLQDLFVDEGVPREMRDRWPVLRTDRGVVWVPGLARPAGWAVAREGQAVRIEVRETDGQRSEISRL